MFNKSLPSLRWHPMSRRGLVYSPTLAPGVCEWYPRESTVPRVWTWRINFGRWLTSSHRVPLLASNHRWRGPSQLSNNIDNHPEGKGILISPQSILRMRIEKGNMSQSDLRFYSKVLKTNYSMLGVWWRWVPVGDQENVPGQSKGGIELLEVVVIDEAPSDLGTPGYMVEHWESHIHGWMG